MKTLATVLILFLILHLQCGGSCLSQSFGARTHDTTNEVPPCHQHGQTRTTPSSQYPQTSCAPGPLIEAKLSTGKILLEWDPTFVAALEMSQPSNLEMLRNTPTDPRIPLFPPTAISVL